jgi:hypothetical protein
MGRHTKPLVPTLASRSQHHVSTISQLGEAPVKYDLFPVILDSLLNAHPLWRPKSRKAAILVHFRSIMACCTKTFTQILYLESQLKNPLRICATSRTGPGYLVSAAVTASAIGLLRTGS